MLIYSREANVSDFSDVTDMSHSSAFLTHDDGLSIIGCIKAGQGSGVFVDLTQALLLNSGTTGSISSYT